MQIRHLERVLDRPARQRVQRRHHLLGLDQHLASTHRAPARAPATWKLVDRDSVGSVNVDLVRGLVATAERDGGPLGDDLARREHRDPVRQRLRLIHVVGGQEDRLAELAQAVDHLPRSPPRRRVKAGRRLIQEHQLWVADQRQRDVQASLLAARQLPAASLWPCSRARRARSPPRPVAAPGSSRHTAPGTRGPSAPARRARSAARRRPARATDDRRAPDRPRVPEPLPPVRLPMALEDLDRRRLARAVGAEEREDLAAPYAKVDAPHGLEAVVGHLQARNLDDGVRPINLALLVGHDCRRQPSPCALSARHAHQATLVARNHLGGEPTSASGACTEALWRLRQEPHISTEAGLVRRSGRAPARRQKRASGACWAASVRC